MEASCCGNTNSQTITNVQTDNPEQKYVIVGAGPAGIHMASILAKKGCKNITILEKSDRIGGKACTVTDNDIDGVVHEFGACYLHAAYQPILKLLQEYDDDNKPVQNPSRATFGIIDYKNDQFDEKHPDIDYSSKSEIDFTDWALKETAIIMNKLDDTGCSIAKLSIFYNYVLFVLFLVVFDF